jgi:hypothetical protein
MDYRRRGLEAKIETRAQVMDWLERLEGGRERIGIEAPGTLVKDEIRRMKALIAEYDLAIGDFEAALAA